MEILVDKESFGSVEIVKIGKMKVSKYFLMGYSRRENNWEKKGKKKKKMRGKRRY